MANMIRLRAGDPEYMRMSNGLTDVFINVLVLSGSKAARTIDEKRLIVWLAEKDQSRVGSGTVGFAITDMPWNRQTFAENRAFLLEVIAAARNRTGWEVLEYTPNEEILFPCLDRFAEIVSQMEAKDVRQDSLEEWLAASDSDPVACGFPLCPRHHVLLTEFGCHICNN
ncbi:MAG: hypothetical protein HDR02_09280 [Lachnospiraceae bacterium]|nr:hypothetical protein [Lachnospiraceae bacterium]